MKTIIKTIYNIFRPKPPPVYDNCYTAYFYHERINLEKNRFGGSHINVDSYCGSHKIFQQYTGCFSFTISPYADFQYERLDVSGLRGFSLHKVMK